MSAVAVEFDKAVYSPGEAIRMTVTVTADDPPATTQPVTGEVRLGDGTTLTFSGQFTLDRAAATLAYATVTADPTGRTWSAPTITGNTAVFTSVA